jgi:signal peptidase I
MTTNENDCCMYATGAILAMIFAMLLATPKMAQTIALIIIVGSALALWKSLCVTLNTECPVVVVLTGSMEPGYYRGDILFV